MLEKVDLGKVTKNDLLDWMPGETILLSGKILTGRDKKKEGEVIMMVSHYLWI